MGGCCARTTCRSSRTADVTHLVDRLGVTDIVDLRSTVEVHLEGPGPLRARELVPHHHHSMFAGDREDAADALALPWSKESGRPATAPPRRRLLDQPLPRLPGRAARLGQCGAPRRRRELGRHDRALRGRQGPHRHGGGHGPVGGGGVRRGHRGGLRRERRAGRAGRGAADASDPPTPRSCVASRSTARPLAPRRCSDSWPCSPSATAGPPGGCASRGGPRRRSRACAPGCARDGGARPRPGACRPATSRAAGHAGAPGGRP